MVNASGTETHLKWSFLNIILIGYQDIGFLVPENAPRFWLSDPVIHSGYVPFLPLLSSLLHVHPISSLRSMMCRGSKGLLTKIVEVMKKEPTASTFRYFFSIHQIVSHALLMFLISSRVCSRFWLARAVESYLRGNTSYCDQIFLLRRGLLQVSVLLLILCQL